MGTLGVDEMRETRQFLLCILLCALAWWEGPRWLQAALVVGGLLYVQDVHGWPFNSEVLQQLRQWWDEMANAPPPPLHEFFSQPPTGQHAHYEGSGNQSDTDDAEGMSRQQRRRHQAGIKRVQKRRAGGSSSSGVSSRVLHNMRSKVYCVVVEGVCTFELRISFNLSDSDWRDLVASAAQTELWRRTQDPKHLLAAVEAAIQKKAAKLFGGQYQQQYQQQQDQQQARPGQPLLSKDKYLAAIAETPQLQGLAVTGLRSFIHECGRPAAAQVSVCNSKDELLDLAQRSLQVWECKRILRCSCLPQATTDQQLLAALCVLRVQTGLLPGEPLAAARAATAADLKRRHKKLALAVHPDKLHITHRHGALVKDFEEAFKHLVAAHELLGKYCKA